jgi:hypothetical protein
MYKIHHYAPYKGGHIQAEAHGQMDSKDESSSPTTPHATQKPRAEQLLLEYASVWNAILDVGTI